MERVPIAKFGVFELFFGSVFFGVPRAPQGPKINDFGSQNGPPKLPKWIPKAPKMVPKIPPEPPKVTPNTISELTDVENNNVNLDGHSKEDLRQKGAAAVFRAACSIRRSTPWCCFGV